MARPLQYSQTMNLSKNILLIVSLIPATFAIACGPGVEAKTVTNSDTTQTGPDGQTKQVTTSDTQVVQTDGVKKGTHTEEVKTTTTPPATK